MTAHYQLTTADAEQWRAALPADACVLGSLEFTRIMEQQTGHEARLFVVESEASRIAYPYLLRPVGELPFADGHGSGRWDTITPEYTGPLRVGDAAPDDERRFAELFAAHCREQGIIAEFAHLNPWYVTDEVLDPACVQLDREVVYVDLTTDMDHIWERSITSDGRRALRQSRKAGVKTRMVDSRDGVLEFHRLHAMTMERRSALDRYFLPPEYFLAFFETMPDNSFFVLSEYEGQVVAGGLYFYDANDIYWYLSAADMEFQRARPANAFHYHAIEWGVEAGRQRMLCGGGYEEGDGVYRFKASFSPLRAPFRVYKRIHDQGSYTGLVEGWSQHHGGGTPPDGYFPAYRSVPQP